MKKLLQKAAVLLLFSSFTTVFAQGTGFTYQGLLNTASGPANGSYDLTFTLFATNSAGVAIAVPVTNSATGVSNGLFTVTINFGASPFTGGSNWLEIAVRTNATGSFTTLAPRQQLTPTPYAIYSANAGNATTATTAGSAATATTATNLTGNVSDAQLSANILRLNGTNTFTGTNTFQGVTLATNVNNVIFGAFTGNGGGLTNLNAAQLSGSAALSNLTLNATLTLPDFNGSAPDIINSGGTQILYADDFENFFIGQETVNVAPTGNINTGVGHDALDSDTSGTENTAVGADALLVNTSGNDNTAVGVGALNSNSTGSDSTAVGLFALSFGNGTENTAIGSQALRGSPSGHIKGTNNIALGYKAGFAYGANESSNIDIGNLGVAGDQNIIRIGTPGVQTNAFIAGTLYGNGGGLTNLNATQLSGSVPSGVTVPAADLTGALPAISGASLTSVSAGNLTGTLPAISGANLTSLNASQLTSGTVPSARVSGTYSSAVTLNNTGNSFIGAMQVGGSGTAFTLVQAGQALMPAGGSSLVETNFTVTFPQAFSSTPKVIASLSGDPGFATASDVFVMSIRAVTTTTGFTVNVMRIDAPTGWSQQLRINWQAWQ